MTDERGCVIGVVPVRHLEHRQTVFVSVISRRRQPGEYCDREIPYGRAETWSVVDVWLRATAPMKIGDLEGHGQVGECGLCFG